MAQEQGPCFAFLYSFRKKQNKTNKNKNVSIAEAVLGDVQVRVHTVLFEGFIFERHGK